MNPDLTFVTVDGHKVSLETMRIRFGWPEGGLWDYDLGRDQFRYQYATGPTTFSVTVGTTEPPLLAPGRWVGKEEVLAMYPMDDGE